MKKETDERTFQMMKSFVQLHQQGHSIAEIAKMYNLSNSTVYKKLGEIAKKAGVERKSLLEKPVEADHSGRNYTPVQPIDPTEIRAKIETTLESLESLKKTISKMLDDYELMDELLQEEFRK